MTDTTSHNWHVYGHDWAVDFLRKGMAHGRTRHAYLITGTQAIGKSMLAHHFAMALNCTHEDEHSRPCGECRSCKRTYSGNHPDLLYSDNDEKTGQLKIDEVRNVIRLLNLKPFDSKYRVAIFHDFDMAQNRAQDALLKTLEEPPSYAVLILLAQSTENIMPTIVSRCQVLSLRPVPAKTIKEVLLMRGTDEDTATLLARLSSGRLGWAIEALQDETVLSFRDEMLNRLREAIQGNRAVRFDIAEKLANETKGDKPRLRYVMEMWQTYWRDVLLQAEQSPVKPCNSDRAGEIQQLVIQINAEDALKALNATQTLLKTLYTNANVRMALEVMFLDYPNLV